MIETSRLYLNYPTNHNIMVIENLWRDEEVRKFLGGIVSDDLIKQNIIDLQNHWERYKFGQWAIVEKISHKTIGLCGLHHSDDGVELSYMFFPSFWGRGYAYEATAASIDHGFNTLKINKIIAITQLANVKSCQLLKRVGMQHIKNFERFKATQCLFMINNSMFV